MWLQKLCAARSGMRCNDSQARGGGFSTFQKPKTVGTAYNLSTNVVRLVPASSCSISTASRYHPFQQDECSTVHSARPVRCDRLLKPRLAGSTSIRHTEGLPTQETPPESFSPELGRTLFEFSAGPESISTRAERGLAAWNDRCLRRVDSIPCSTKRRRLPNVCTSGKDRASAFYGTSGNVLYS